ncbi:IS110 family transposase [Mycobacterium sp. E796]|uniref:IS110 family transposase n=1 Tax=Mycobacterium sp. E796 TaxID=1834151 RepID=UPI000801E167|nr:IS110 family transposase [Mycobacterium sp. E796]OBI56482.1 transposase [Mycobacterium sp. E796]
MQYPPVRLADQPANGLTCGIDWARDDHAITIIDTDARPVYRGVIEHSAKGLKDLIEVLAGTGVHEVAIERPDGPVVEALLDAGVTVVVINPHQVKNLRSRYGSAGNKDDRFDAFVLADTLRTDRARLRPLTPDTPATTALRALCRARKDLVIHRVRVANQLRAHLARVYPAPIGVFDALDSPISLRFLTRFDCQDRLDWLTPTRLASWLGSVGYKGRTDAAVLHARLSGRPRGLTGPDGAAYVGITTAFVATLTNLVSQIAQLSAQIADQLATHADAHIFTSLPRSGTLRAARLLAEIGDCRARFPTPDALACLAGVAPSTRQSGKMRSVGFRWACDKQLRDAVCDFANDSRHANPWAADLYNRARARGHDHPHATRILARAWLHVIWHCWQTNTPYDPAQHQALQTLLNQRSETAT